MKMSGSAVCVRSCSILCFKTNEPENPGSCLRTLMPTDTIASDQSGWHLDLDPHVPKSVRKVKTVPRSIQFPDVLLQW